MLRFMGLQEREKMVFSLLKLEKQKLTKKYTNCLLCIQLPGSHPRKTSSSLGAHNRPSQCPLFLGPGLLHIRGEGKLGVALESLQGLRDLT